MTSNKIFNYRKEPESILQYSANQTVLINACLRLINQTQKRIIGKNSALIEK